MGTSVILPSAQSTSIEKKMTEMLLLALLREVEPVLVITDVRYSSRSCARLNFP